MTYETSHKCPGAPAGCEITYHELRGYDSPDRWFEAHRGSTNLGSFGTFSEAVEACLAGSRSISHDRYIVLHAARLMMEALWLAAHDHISLHDALSLVGLEEA